LFREPLFRGSGQGFARLLEFGGFGPVLELAPKSAPVQTKELENNEEIPANRNVR
jgi:hypothetical protein